MKLISMNSLNFEEILTLVNNNNTGVEFEYALFYLLNPESKRELFFSKVIQSHRSRDKIIEIVKNSHFEKLELRLSKSLWANYEVLLATQNDDIGPADIVLKRSNSDLLGLSVKYENNCSLNITGRSFLTSTSLNNLNNELSITCSNYIIDMQTRFGNIENWFRKRKTSIVTDKFIDKIRDCVILDWSKKNVTERKDLVDKFFHANSPINYWVVKYLNSTNNKYDLEIISNPIKNIIPENVTLSKKGTSYVAFNYQGVVIAQMQVKFNNGILQNSNGINYDFLIMNKKIKAGDPFSSWNVNT